MFNRENLFSILNELKLHHATLVAVSKTKPVEVIKEVYDSGHRVFGENYVQELTSKHNELPEDIDWHFIGHLQSNKVKLIAPFVSMIQSVDSLKLLREIDKEGLRNSRIIRCLLQVHIATEETKFGFDKEEAAALLNSSEIETLSNVNVCGLMGMASNTDDIDQVRKEFHSLKLFYEKMKLQINLPNASFTTFSMGMTGDYKIALEEGSNLVRIGSAIFGERH